MACAVFDEVNDYVCTHDIRNIKESLLEVKENLHSILGHPLSI